MTTAIDNAQSVGGQRITTERTEDEIHLEIARCKAKLQYDKVQKYDQDTLTKLIAGKEQHIEKNKMIYKNLKTSIYTVSIRSVLLFFMIFLTYLICNTFQLRRSLKYRFGFLKKFKEHMGMLMKMSFEVNFLLFILSMKFLKPTMTALALVLKYFLQFNILDDINIT